MGRQVIQGRWKQHFIILAVLFYSTFALFPTKLLASEVRLIPLYTYHIAPPFIMEGESQGLTYALADYLNDHLADEFLFRVVALPRSRLNQRATEMGEDGLVPWVNPGWFREDKYPGVHWSIPYQKGSNAMISPSDRPLNFSGLDGLKDMNFVAPSGHVLLGLDKMVESGQLNRHGTPSYLSGMKMIAAARADFMVLPDATARYIAKEHQLKQSIHFSNPPIHSYRRHIMVLNGNSELKRKIDQVLDRLVRDPIWLAELDLYDVGSQA